MTGELVALASAALYALSGVAIARGAAERPALRGDNGAFLSIVLSAIFSLILWLATGGPRSLSGADTGGALTAVLFFVGAGIFSNVLGRVAIFRSVELGGAVRASMMRRLTPVVAALLAATILAEIPTVPALVGMGLILAGTGLSGWPAKGGVAAQRWWALWGGAAAASYGISYVLRKMAMTLLPGAVFGSLVGAVTGLFWYILSAPFNPRTRRALTGMFRDTGRWQILTATTMALAQMGQFVALALTDVATVAVIGSTETLISIILAGWVFGTEAKPSRLLLTGVFLSTSGVVLVALFAGHG